MPISAAWVPPIYPLVILLLDSFGDGQATLVQPLNKDRGASPMIKAQAQTGLAGHQSSGVVLANRSPMWIFCAFIRIFTLVTPPAL